MGCDYYSVWYGEVLLAEHMSIGNACLFIEALFQKFYNEPDLMYTIKRETPVESGEE